MYIYIYMYTYLDIQDMWNKGYRYKIRGAQDWQLYHGGTRFVLGLDLLA